MKAVHFGAGNIGRGFIGEVLFDSGFKTTFIDVNDEIIKALNHDQQYELQYTDGTDSSKLIEGVCGINSKTNPEEVKEAISECDLLTVAIGPNIIPYIAPLIAEGLRLRRERSPETALDVIACENMINASTFLKEEVYRHIEQSEKESFDRHFGFPDSAVDRIVINAGSENLLTIAAERFKEWIINRSQIKNTGISLEFVKYVDQLEPYIERKLYIINAGHAAAAYYGFYLDHKKMADVFRDSRVESFYRAVTNEAKALILKKWDFSEEVLDAYIESSVERFKNPYITDQVTRVARTPIRKLGNNERFIRTISELYANNLPHHNLVMASGYVLRYHDESDTEAVELHERLKKEKTPDVIRDITGLDNNKLINDIAVAYISSIKG